MSRWTTAISLPDIPDSDKKVQCVNVKNDVWILVDFYKSSRPTLVTKLYIYVVGDELLREVPCWFPDEFENLCHCMTSDNDVIYVWRTTSIGRGLRYFKLFKFDTKTRVWDYMMDLESHSIYGSTPVIDGKMCVLDQDFEHKMLYLTVIDLSVKAITTINNLGPMPKEMSNKLIHAHNNELYLFIFYEVSGFRTVSKIMNGQVVLLNSNNYQNIDNLQLIDFFSGNAIYDSSTKPITYLILDTYDFETNLWNRQTIERAWFRSFKDNLDSAVEINGVIYSIVNAKSPKRSIEIRSFDRNVSLKHICLLNIVDKLLSVMDIEGVIRIRPMLQGDLRTIFDNMMQWRLNDYSDRLTIGGFLNLQGTPFPLFIMKYPYEVKY